LFFSISYWQYEKALPKRKFSPEIASAIDVEVSHLYIRNSVFYTGKLRNVENLSKLLRKDSTFEFFDNCEIKKMPQLGNYEIFSKGKSVGLIQLFDAPPNFEFNFNASFEFFTNTNTGDMNKEGIGEFLLCKDGKFGYLFFFKS
jgi:hypothetical protein